MTELVTAGECKKRLNLTRNLWRYYSERLGSGQRFYAWEQVLEIHRKKNEIPRSVPPGYMLKSRCDKRYHKSSSTILKLFRRADAPKPAGKVITERNQITYYYDVAEVDDFMKKVNHEIFNRPCVVCVKPLKSYKVESIKHRDCKLNIKVKEFKAKIETIENEKDFNINPMMGVRLNPHRVKFATWDFRTSGVFT